MLVCANAAVIPLADETVQCCVTSPPYWGLRKYAGEQELIWDGAEGCQHEWTEARRDGHLRSESWQRGEKQRSCRGSEYNTAPTNVCHLCGAWRGAFGLEPTIEMYVAHTVTVLREIRRVLRKDGVCFWNLGDSYAGAKGYGGDLKPSDKQASNRGSVRRDPNGYLPNRNGRHGLKPKDLCLIPSRVAIAAQADGWWVRSMIVWAKPNPMPESVTDRPTDAYEYILMLTKSERYFWDADAVREKAVAGWNGSSFTDPRDVEIYPGLGLKPRGTHSRGNGDGGKKARARASEGVHEGWTETTREVLEYRNMRNVWAFATQPFSGAHFATFPEEIPRRCIKAASKVGDLILDPFGGSGTTGRVAIELQRRCVLLDLAYAHDYAPLARARTSNVQLEAFA